MVLVTKRTPPFQVIGQNHRFFVGVKYTDKNCSMYKYFGSEKGEHCTFDVGKGRHF